MTLKCTQPTTTDNTKPDGLLNQGLLKNVNKPNPSQVDGLH